MLHKLALAIAGLFFAVGSWFSPLPQPNLNLGGTNFLPVQTQKATLSASGIGISDVTIGLTSFKLPDGSTNITMSNFGTIGYGTLEPGTSKEESISFTGVTQNANGTATLTGVTRGLRFVYPYDSVSANKLTHAGGATFVVSNTAPFYFNQFVLKNSDGTVSSILTFASTTPPQYDANYNASGNQFVSFNQLNATAIQGAATATEASMGLVQLATNSQAAAGTASSTSGSPLVLLSRYATSTYNARFSNNVVVTGSSNTIDRNFIATSSSDIYDFSGNITMSTSTIGTLNTGSETATSSLNIGQIKIPASYSTYASTSVLMADVNGNFAPRAESWTLLTSASFGTAATNTISFVPMNNLHIVMYHPGTTAATDQTLFFNTDTAIADYGGEHWNNYAQVYKCNNGCYDWNEPTTTPAYITMDVLNATSTLKVLHYTKTFTNNTGATGLNGLETGTWLWDDGSNQIYKMIFTYRPSDPVNTFKSGMNIWVYGSN